MNGFKNFFRWMGMFFLSFFLLGSPLGSPALASIELDQLYALETIGYLKSSDNIDGILETTIDTIYQNYFTKQNRFSVHDLSSLHLLLKNAQIPYQKTIADLDILTQIAKSTQTETLLKTQILKKETQYFVTLEWLHYPRMELLAKNHFTLEKAQDQLSLNLEKVSSEFHEHLNQLFSSVPMLTSITGRDHQWVTLNINIPDPIKKGDILVIATLDRVEKHPLTQAILDWKWIQTGKVQVESIENSMAFGTILEENSPHTILKHQKIIAIEPPTTPLSPPREQETDSNWMQNSSEQNLDSLNSPIHLGWLSLALWSGLAQWQYTTDQPNALTHTGSGLLLGPQLEGELWYTRKWFSNVTWAYGIWHFSQRDLSTGSLTPASQAGGVQGSLMKTQLTLGYSHLFEDDPLGLRGWIQWGYQNWTLSLPISAIENTGPLSLNTGLLGIGCDWPIQNTPWGLRSHLNIGLFSWLGHSQQTWISTAAQKITTLDFYLGAYYRLRTPMALKLGFQFQQSGVHFSGVTAITQTVIAITPSFVYFF